MVGVPFNQVRNALLVHYAFYKNAAVFLVLAWLAFFSGFSAQVLAAHSFIVFVCVDFLN